MTEPPPTGPSPHDPYPAPPAPAPGGSRPRRGVLLASVIFAVVLLLCAGGGVAAFLLLRDAEAGEGAPEPIAAVDSFLRAVYEDRDVATANGLVCSAARDAAVIDRKVQEVVRQASAYPDPRFEWSPPQIEERTGDTARVSTVLTMTSSDERVAEQRIAFQVVNQTGWRVCEVTT